MKPCCPKKMSIFILEFVNSNFTNMLETWINIFEKPNRYPKHIAWASYECDYEKISKTMTQMCYVQEVSKILKKREFVDHIIEYQNLEKIGASSEIGFGTIKIFDHEIYFGHSSMGFYISDKSWKIMRYLISPKDLEIYRTLIFDIETAKKKLIYEEFAKYNIPSDLTLIIITYIQI